MNMSYCRFRNTSDDVEDCMEALNNIVEGDEEKLESDEYRACKNMLEDIIDFLYENDIIEEDENENGTTVNDRLKDFLEQIKK